MRVNVYRHKEIPAAVESNEPNHAPNEPKGGLAAEVIRLLIEDADLTIEGLAKTCGVSRETVKRTLKILKDAGRIRRIGRTRGHWEIVSGQ